MSILYDVIGDFVRCKCNIFFATVGVNRFNCMLFITQLYCFNIFFLWV